MDLISYTLSKKYADDMNVYKFDKICPQLTVSGYPVMISDSLGDAHIKDYKIYGTTTEDETLQYVGDLVTDTSSEHYGKYDIPIKVTGKNLFKYGQAEYANATLIENILDENGNKIGAVLQGKAGSTPGSGLNSNGWFRPGNSSHSNNICPKLYTGQTVTVSVDYKILEANESFNGVVGLYLYSREKKDGYTQLIYNVIAGKNYRLSITYTVSSSYNGNTFYPIISLNSSKVEIKNLQIEFGTAKTDYEPYKCETTHIYIDEPLKDGDTLTYSDTGIAVPTFKGINNITLGTSVKPSNMEVTYYQDINKKLAELQNAIAALGSV